MVLLRFTFGRVWAAIDEMVSSELMVNIHLQVLGLRVIIEQVNIPTNYWWFTKLVIYSITDSNNNSHFKIFIYLRYWQSQRLKEWLNGRFATNLWCCHFSRPKVSQTTLFFENHTSQNGNWRQAASLFYGMVCKIWAMILVWVLQSTRPGTSRLRRQPTW